MLNRTAVGGIIGKLSFDSEETIARAALDQMLDALAQAPHAQRAVHTVPGLALGSCGDSAAAVVAANQRRTLHVVADARLTNAPALRRELDALGHQILTAGDAELIAHAFEEWGISCFTRLHGPFACGIWDSERRRLVIARDHLGVRPLFFAVLQNHGLVFASAMRALLPDPGVGRQWCPDAIDAYLTLGYVPAPLTPYRRISKLEPAQALVVEGRRFHVEPFWSLPAAADAVAVDDSCAALDGCARRVIRRQLSGETREGILYSGGVGSSLLLAAAPRQADPVVTVLLDDGTLDVTRSDAAATSAGRQREIEDLSTTMPALATELASRLEEPLADPAAITQFAICTAAARHAEVMLGAHGAGMLFSRAPFSRRLWSDMQRRALYTRAFAWQLRDGNPFVEDLNTRHGAQLRSYLADDLLAAATRAAAAAEIEVRFPFLDREFVEQAVSTRAVLAGQGRIDVNPLRLVLTQYLPWSLMPPAMGRQQRHPWLHLTLPALVRSMLLTPRFDGRGIVSRPFLARLWDEHQSGRRDHAYRLWSLLVLEFWFREHIDGAAASEPLEYAVLKVA